MIYKILVLFIFCVTSTLSRSISDKLFVKEDTIDGKQITNHFSNHPPVEARDIPVQVIYDAPTTFRSAKDSRALITRGNVRFGSKTTDDAESKLPEKEPTTLGSLSSTTILMSTKISTTPASVQEKTTESNHIKSTEVVTQKPKTKQNKTKNADFQIPVSIVIDEIIHKVKSRAEDHENISLENSTKDQEFTKKVAEEKNDTLHINTTREKNEVTTEKTKTQTEDVATTKEIENNSRKSKLVRQRDPIIPIIESENQIYAQTGKFKYSYEGGDGTKSFQSGVLKGVDEEHMGEAVVGGFSYKDEEGNDFMISYTADENGYRPVGAHLPTPPPVPPAIARALLYLATKTTPEPVTKSIQETE